MNLRMDSRDKRTYVAMLPKTLLALLDLSREAPPGRDVEGQGLQVLLPVHPDVSSFVCEVYVGSQCAKQASRL